MYGQRWLTQVLSLFLGMIGMLLIVAGGLNLAYTSQQRESQQAAQQVDASAPTSFVLPVAAAEIERQGFHAQTLDGRDTPGTRNLTPAGSAPRLGVLPLTAPPAETGSAGSPGANPNLPSTRRISNGAPAKVAISNPADVAAAAPTTAAPSSGAVLRAPSEAPTRIVIPAIKLDAPIIPVPMAYKEGDPAGQYIVADYRVVGWHADSARLGEVGNLVMNGHHNVYGRVFEHLKDLQPGDAIIVYGDQRVITYTLTERHLLLERGVSMNVRLEHARFMQPTTEQLLTLITCWPPKDYSHRLILVARPVAEAQVESGQH